MHFFNHKICVCAHLTQTRYVQRMCAEKEIKCKKIHSLRDSFVRKF